MAQPTREVLCPECGRIRRVHARGLCNTCYSRLHKVRGVEGVIQFKRRYRAADEWFSMIDTSDPEACWLWPGPINTHGYGATYPDGLAHRWAYRTFVGPIAARMQIDHVCHNRTSCNLNELCPHRACVNYLNHLEVVTGAENKRRSPNLRN